MFEWTTDNREWYRTVYLKSEHWKTLRGKKLELNPSCEICGKIGVMDVHHVNYRQLFDVQLTDLLTVCRKCHDGIHKHCPPEKRQKEEFVAVAAQQVSIANEQFKLKRIKTEQWWADNRTRRMQCSQSSYRPFPSAPAGKKYVSVPVIAMLSLFGGCCFACHSAKLAVEVRLVKFRTQIGSRCRGIPVCQQCAQVPLSNEQENAAKALLDSIPSEKYGDAFRAAQVSPPLL